MVRSWFVLIGTPVASFVYQDKYACGVCHEIIAGESCERFGSCHEVNSSVIALGCGNLCREAQFGPVAAEGLEVRIAKGFGTKGYDQIRVSVVSDSITPPVPGFFDYSAQFKYKWTNNYLHTAMKTVIPGQKTTFDLGSPVSVSLPKQGDGVVGVLLADPCIAGSKVGCKYADQFQTTVRTPELINTFAGGADTDFWGIFGDNFYDQTGELTSGVFSGISLEAKSKIFTTVAGNHDYWVLGSPLVGTTSDQCANGHLQYYGQDPKAAEHVLAGDTSAPYDFSVDPNKGHLLLGCSVPAINNHFWYNQIGNVGLVGQSGAYSVSDATPFMKEACQWLGEQNGLDVAVLIGHWDISGLGASKDMAMPQWYETMSAYPGCDEFNNRGMLKFIMGHSHCNDPHPHGKVDAGFRVAGFGMSDTCADGTRYGMPLLDTTGGRVRFWYFDTMTDATFNNVTTCVKQNGWRKCTDQAILWLDQEIVPKQIDVTVV